MLKITDLLQETIFKNFHAIEFFPHKFMEYLLSPMVGFAKSEVLCYPHHQYKGFQRYIYIYTKSTMYPSERVECPPTPPTKNSPTPPPKKPPTPFDDSVKEQQETTDSLENCSSSCLLEEEVIPIPLLRSGSSNSGDVVYIDHGNGYGGDESSSSPRGLVVEERVADYNSPQMQADVGPLRVAGPLPGDGDDEASRIAGPPPAEEQVVVQNGVYMNGMGGSSPNYPVENGVVANDEEENLSGDNT